MTDLTVVILTKNEEKNIRKCVESFGTAAKRFVIVDSFSDDGTEEICRALDAELRKSGARLDFYRHEWSNYAEQFNWGLDNTGIDTEWTMRMDADEELLPALAEEIEKKLPETDAETGGIILRRRVYFMGRWLRHGGKYPEKLLRIFRTGKARVEQRLMDEHILLSEGKTQEFQNDLMDNNQKDLEWWTAKHNWYSNREVADHIQTEENGSEFSALNDQAKRKRKIKDGYYYRLPKFFRAHLYFIYRYYIRLGFLDGKEGKIYTFLQAYWYRFLVDAKMYESEKTGRKFDGGGDLKG